MLWAINSALDDDLIHLIARDDEMGIYEFRVGKLKTIVTVEVGRLPSSERARYHRSHDIKTPIQAGPYHQRPFCWDDVPYALHQAIGSITTYYRLAIADGHEPQEEWLVECRSAWPWRLTEDPKTNPAPPA
jgi:hypothetical protein